MRRRQRSPDRVSPEHRSAGPRQTTGWFALGPVNIAGRIVDLKFHPTDPASVYAAAASGGLWISSDGGDTWRTTTDDLPSLAIGAVCVLPTNPDVVLVGDGAQARSRVLYDVARQLRDGGGQSSLVSQPKA